MKNHKLNKTPSFDPDVVTHVLAQKKAEEMRRQSMQGKGRPIISTNFKGQKLVTVGNTLHYSPEEKTKTFSDFLSNYVRELFAPEWGNTEIAKPFDQRHTFMQWYDGLCRLQQKHYKQGEVFETPATGLVVAYTSLAYNLYLLGHNVEIQTHLLQRLKNKDSFYSALYETHVAAWFILAGFELSLENEQDSTTTHCEFTAKAPSGACYSVEAKSRDPLKENFAIGNQLYKALKKNASYQRIVCIDMAIRQEHIDNQKAFIDKIVSRIRRKETTLKINGELAPPAYIFVTNIPHHLHLRDERAKRALLADGFKIEDFGYKKFPSLTAGYKARLKHADVYSVMESFEKYTIPSTFDGELPEFSFGNAERRFILGDRHKLSDTVIGVLMNGLVSEAEKKATLIFQTDCGKSAIYTAELSNAEIAAYKRHPETFFGKIAPVGSKCETAMELFEFFYESLKDTPREKMLDWFSTSLDLTELKNLSTPELAFAYTERHVMAVIKDNPMPDIELT